VKKKSINQKMFFFKCSFRNPPRAFEFVIFLCQSSKFFFIAFFYYDSNKIRTFVNIVSEFRLGLDHCLIKFQKSELRFKFVKNFVSCRDSVETKVLM